MGELFSFPLITYFYYLPGQTIIPTYFSIKVPVDILYSFKIQLVLFQNINDYPQQMPLRQGAAKLSIIRLYNSVYLFGVNPSTSKIEPERFNNISVVT